MSLARKATPAASAASWTVLTKACRALGDRVRHRLSASSASTPRKRRKATAAIRCSNSTSPGRRCVPKDGGKAGLDRLGGTGRRARAPMGGTGAPAPAEHLAPPGPGRVAPRGRRRAISGLTKIWPADAACSICVVRVAAGPAMISSRWRVPTWNSCTVPEWSPTDIRSCTRPNDIGTCVAARSAARISTAARRSLLGVVLAVEQEEQGVPAELEERPAPFERDLEHGAEHAVQDVGQLLDADPTTEGQALRERGEARRCRRSRGCRRARASGPPVRRCPTRTRPEARTGRGVSERPVACPIEVRAPPLRPPSAGPAGGPRVRPWNEPRSGRTGIQVSRYCLGAMMFGAWGNRDHDESIRIIHTALDAGHQLHRHRRRLLRR